jgi:hypothetical protein
MNSDSQLASAKYFERGSWSSQAELAGRKQKLWELI